MYSEETSIYHGRQLWLPTLSSGRPQFGKSTDLSAAAGIINIFRGRCLRSRGGNPRGLRPP